MKNEKPNSAAERRAQAIKKIKARRHRRVALVVMEALMVAVLSVCCYGVSVLGLMQHGKLSGDIYIASIAEAAPAATQAESSTAKPTAETTQSKPSGQNSEKTEAATEATTEVQNVVVWESQEEISHQDTMDGFWNILIIGVDASSGEDLTKGGNSDVLMIASINTKTKEVKLASIYRDTYLRMYHTQSNGSYAYNKANSELAGYGLADTLSMINMNLDMQIQDVVIVNWAAVANAIDQLGGMELTISDEEVGGKLNIINGYITDIVANTGLAATQIEKPGTQWVTGVQAVAYCRNRYLSLDYGRTSRQREVLEKLLDQAKKADLTTLIKACNTVLPNIYTTLDAGEILQLARSVTSYSIDGTIGFPIYKYADAYVGSCSDSKYIGNTRMQDPVVPIDLAANVTKLHEFLFGENSGYTPSTMVQEISDDIKSISGLSDISMSQ